MAKDRQTAVLTHMKKKVFPETSKSRVETRFPHKKASNLDEKSQWQPRPPKR